MRKARLKSVRCLPRQNLPQGVNKGLTDPARIAQHELVTAQRGKGRELKSIQINGLNKNRPFGTLFAM
jgi:hypothetical protein